MSRAGLEQQEHEPLSAAEVEAAFAGRVAAVPLPLAYRLGLLAVALGSALLVLAYLALVVAGGYFVYLYAVRAQFLLTEGRVSFGRGLAYFGPLLVGVMIVFFTVKPLLAPRARPPRRIRVGAEEAPLLHAFIEQLRRAVGAPAPRVVELDCAVNASASLRRGLLSFFGDDLVLTIGLPLFEGLSARQLAGVLAHELGHFAQGGSMRLTYLIRVINAWFARVVYERDSWDEALARGAREWDWRIGIVLHVARFFIWLSRQLLRLLMLAGHAIGMYMLRQMEYDADRYEARLAGSDAFAGTAMRLRVLSVAQSRALSLLQSSWAQRRLCDDLPQLTAALAGRMPAELLQKIAELDHEEAKPGAFDTHPPDRARIESAQRERAPGLFTLERPAAHLQPNLPELNRRATEHHFTEVLEIDLADAKLVPFAQYLAELDADEKAQEAAEGYFGVRFTPFHPLSLPSELAPALPSPESALAELRESVPAIAAAGALAKSAPPTDAPSWMSTPPGIGPARAAVETRLRAAFGLLARPEIRARLSDPAATERELRTLVHTLAGVGREAEALRAVAMAAQEADARLRSHFADREDSSHASAALQALGELHGRLSAVVARLEEIPYPFEHAAGPLSVRRYAAGELRDVDTNDAGLVPFTESALERLFALYFRASGRLAQIALTVEQAAGLLPEAPAPLATPPIDPQPPTAHV